MKKYIFWFALSMALFMAFFSCKQFVQIPDAKNKLPTAAVFADSTDATSAVLGLYITAMGNPSIGVFFVGPVTVFTGLASDEIRPTSGSVNDLQPYVNAVSSRDNAPNVNNWGNGYSWIYQTNACIEGLTNSSGISSSAKNQLVGEAKVFRALCYFYLLNLFGPVPLVTTTDYKTNSVMTRTSIDSVYQQIVNDLTDAQQLLSPSYPSARNVRPNLYTADALLSRVYLYLKQWQKAETLATAIISSGMYNLEPNLDSVFLAGSTEAIWQLIPSQSGTETAEGTIFIPSSQQILPNYIISSYLYNSFEDSDLRKVNWLDSNVVNNVAYYYPFKYQLTGFDGSSTPVENYMLFRLAEQYLIRAEARAQQRNITGANSAASDLNIIRGRAGLSPTTAVTQSDMLTSIYHERQVELFCELGNRWFDLKRTGLVNSVMGEPGNVCASKGGTWNTDWGLFPVPFSQLQLNVFLTQNQGYN